MKKISDFNSATEKYPVIYAGSATRPEFVDMPTTLQQQEGVAPMDTLPAQWWNAMWKLATKDINAFRDYVGDAFTEINNLLTKFGITLEDANSSQLYDFFHNAYVQNYLNDIFVNKNGDTIEGDLHIKGNLSVDGISDMVDANSRFEYKDITSMFDAGTVSQDIANNDFSKYSLGNYIKKTITIPSYTNGTIPIDAQNITVRIVFAHFNLFYAGSLPDVAVPYSKDSYANILTPHVACIICDLPACAMNPSDTTSGGYFNSYMHNHFLTEGISSALSSVGITTTNHLLSHSKLLTTSINNSGYNRNGNNSGCSATWEWKDNQFISLLSEVQLYGSIIWSSSGYDTGEANEKLALFNFIKPNQLFGEKETWLRDVSSATEFAFLSASGNACSLGAGSTIISPAPLILFK